VRFDPPAIEESSNWVYSLGELAAVNSSTEGFNYENVQDKHREFGE
jgi:hypothetical protein